MKKTIEQKKGYRTIMKSDGKHLYKRPFFCPYEKCGTITSNLDDESIQNYGVCRLCCIMLIEDRKVPLIDIEFYKERLRKRGY